MSQRQLKKWRDQLQVGDKVWFYGRHGLNGRLFPMQGCILEKNDIELDGLWYKISNKKGMWNNQHVFSSCADTLRHLMKEQSKEIALWRQVIQRKRKEISRLQREQVSRRKTYDLLAFRLESTW